MTDGRPAIPDHVSIDEASPHYWPDYTKLRVWLDDVERKGDCVEFCVSEGWIKVGVKNWRDQLKRERGKPLAFMRRGVVKVRYK